MRTGMLLMAASAAIAPLGAVAADLLPSLPAVAVEQAQAGNIRLVAWKLAGGGIEAQALDPATHAAVSGRIALGLSEPGGAAPRLGGVHARPAVAGLAGDEGDAIFFIAWHAGILDENGNDAGTEIVGQRVVVDGVTGTASAGPLLRISHVDDDTNTSAASEPRSAPVVVAHEIEDEFLVLWTHWSGGKSLSDVPPATHDDLFIHGQQVSADGLLSGGNIRLDALRAPTADGLPVRRDTSTIFLAAVPRIAESGYLLAWSDPAQEDSDRDLAQVYAKLLPADLAAVDPERRIGLTDSSGIIDGTGRIALAPLPSGTGYLLAYEDRRGKSPLGGIVLGTDGSADGEPFILLDRMQTGDHAYLTPRLVSLSAQERLLLYAAAGDRDISGTVPDHETPLKDGRLVRRRLNTDALAFSPFADDFDVLAEAYPEVTVLFAAHAHAAGALPDQSGDVVFVAVPDETRIAVIERRIDTSAPSADAPPGTAPDANVATGGGALAFLLPLLGVIAMRRRFPVVALAATLPVSSHAAPPDVELLYSASNGAACYRAVMYREVTELDLGTRWGESPVPAAPVIEIIDLPAGWRAEAIIERDRQYLRLQPAVFDVASGVSIGKICVRFPPMKADPGALPYTYELAATGSRISARARKDDGISESELRALARRGKRLEKGDIDAPKELEQAGKTIERLKGLFD